MLDWMPRRRKRRAEQAKAEAEAAETARREEEADTDIRKAYMLAHQLAEYRRQDPFAQLVRKAYGGGGEHT